MSLGSLQLPSICRQAVCGPRSWASVRHSACVHRRDGSIERASHSGDCQHPHDNHRAVCGIPHGLPFHFCARDLEVSLNSCSIPSFAIERYVTRYVMQYF